MNKLEEAVKRLFNDFQKENPIVPDDDIRPFELGFLYGIKWQTERMYSLDDIKNALKNGYGIKYFSEQKFLENLEQFKKK